MPALYALYIINKSGGLIYNKEFLPMSGLNLNDTLRLASIWHSLHAIASQLSPVPGCTGIDLLAADTFDLHCFQTLTGTKFLLVVDPGTPEIEDFLRSTIYDLYTDYVLKNPFYEVEMPVRCELFDTNLFQNTLAMQAVPLAIASPCGLGRNSVKRLLLYKRNVVRNAMLYAYSTTMLTTLAALTEQFMYAVNALTRLRACRQGRAQSVCEMSKDASATGQTDVQSSNRPCVACDELLSPSSKLPQPVRI